MATPDNILTIILRDAARGAGALYFDWLYKCAVLNWFDEDAIENFISPRDQSDRNVFLEIISTSSLVEETLSGWRIHDYARELLIEDLKKVDPQQLIELHEQAVIYYRARLTKTSVHDSYRRIMLELLYHALRYNEEEGVLLIVHFFRNVSQGFGPVNYKSLLQGYTLNDNSKTLLSFWVNGSLHP